MSVAVEQGSSSMSQPTQANYVIHKKGDNKSTSICCYLLIDVD